MRAAAVKWAKRGGVAGSVLAGAAVADLVANDNIDDLWYYPTLLRNQYSPPGVDKKRVVVLGTGWGAMNFIRKLDPEIFDVTIVSPRNFFFYTPMLAGVTTGTVKGTSIMESIRQMRPMPKAKFVRGECQDVDPEKRQVICRDNHGEINLEYDHLVIAVGAQPNTFGIPGVQENAFFLKELEHSTALRRKILDSLESAETARIGGDFDRMRKLLSFVVVGGGPTGVELTGELVDFMKSDVKLHFPHLADEVKIKLVEALPKVLPVFSDPVREHVTEHLQNQGVEVLTNTMVTKVEDDIIHTKTKAGEVSEISYNTLVWVAGIGARPITQKIAAAIGEGQGDRRGLVVDEMLRVKGAPENEIFALGDCAFSGYAPTAQVASQQGRYLGRVFRDERANPATKFTYNHQGTMAYIGASEAATSFPMLGKSRMGNFFFFRWMYENKGDNNSVLGKAGFALWRSIYFTQLQSYRNRFNVGTDWLRVLFFGRNVSSPLQGAKCQSETKQ